MRQAKLIAIVVLLLSAGIVIAQNWEPVNTNILLWSVQPPLAALLIGTLVVGYGLGLLTTALWKVRVWRSEAMAARKMASLHSGSAVPPVPPASSTPTSTPTSTPGNPTAGS